jgi:transposase-like protein
MDKRKRYTAEEKVLVLREVLEDGKSISVAADEHSIHPNLVLNWRKQLFEGAVCIFEIKRPEIGAKANERRIQELERQLALKDRVIAEIAQENLVLKKKPFGRVLVSV